MSPLITVLIPWLVMPAPPPIDPKVEAVPRFGPTGPTARPVVKVHGFGTTPAASALPARSVAAFVIVAVYCVLGCEVGCGREGRDVVHGVVGNCSSNCGASGSSDGHGKCAGSGDG